MNYADLGYEDRTIKGLGIQDTHYRFQIPLNWALTPGAKARLLFSHSPLLDPSRSSITLLLNNTPIASTALDQNNAVSGELEALIPPWAAIEWALLGESWMQNASTL